MKKEIVTLHDIYKAEENLMKSGLVFPTLLKYCVNLSKQYNAKIWHCVETIQLVKSFKIRGACNALLNLTPAQRKKGVICASAGNHAQGTAISATKLGIKSYICMPSSAPLAKVNATKGFGGNVILAPEPSFDAAYALSKKLAKQKGLTEIPPYDHPDVIAGQGTIGLEIIKELPSVDMVVVPIGGGGLIAGISTFLKGINPKIEVIGVQAENFPAMKKSFDGNKLVSYAKGVPTYADGCAVKTPGTLTYQIVKEKVDKIVTVSEDEIMRGIEVLAESGKQIAEGAGAMPTAAILAGKINVKGKKVVLLISGGNIDPDKLLHSINHGLEVQGRRIRIFAELDSSKKVANFVDLVAQNNSTVWTLDTECRLAKTAKPGKHLLSIIGYSKQDIINLQKKIKSCGIKFKLI